MRRAHEQERAEQRRGRAGDVGDGTHDAHDSPARAQHGVTAADLVVTPSQFSVSYLDGDTVPTAEVVPLYVAEQLAAQAFDIGYHNAKSRTEHIAVRLGCDPSKVRRMRDPSAHKHGRRP